MRFALCIYFMMIDRGAKRFFDSLICFGEELDKE